MMRQGGGGYIAVYLYITPSPGHNIGNCSGLYRDIVQ